MRVDIVLVSLFFFICYFSSFDPGMDKALCDRTFVVVRYPLKNHEIEDSNHKIETVIILDIIGVLYQDGVSSLCCKFHIGECQGRLLWALFQKWVTYPCESDTPMWSEFFSS